AMVRWRSDRWTVFHLRLRGGCRTRKEIIPGLTARRLRPEGRPVDTVETRKRAVGGRGCQAFRQGGNSRLAVDAVPYLPAGRYFLVTAGHKTLVNAAAPSRVRWMLSRLSSSGAHSRASIRRAPKRSL